MATCLSVPIPGSVVLFASGLLGLGLWMRAQKNQAQLTIG
jgi:hypothetical protein